MNTILLGEAPDVEPAANAWFPLAVGNAWTYTVKSGEASTHYTVRVVSKVPWKGGAAYRAETAFGTVSVPCQWISTEEGLWRRNRPAEPESPWAVEHVLSLADGQPVERFGSTYRREPAEPVSVPSGAFADVLHVRQQRDGKTCDLWYARGVGLIKRACAETGVVESLTAYKVGTP